VNKEDENFSLKNGLFIQNLLMGEMVLIGLKIFIAYNVGVYLRGICLLNTVLTFKWLRD